MQTNPKTFVVKLQVTCGGGELVVLCWTHSMKEVRAAVSGKTSPAAPAGLAPPGFLNTYTMSEAVRLSLLVRRLWFLFVGVESCCRPIQISVYDMCRHQCEFQHLGAWHSRDLVRILFLNARTVSLDPTIPQRRCGGSVAGGGNDWLMTVTSCTLWDCFQVLFLALASLNGTFLTETTRLPC